MPKTVGNSVSKKRLNRTIEVYNTRPPKEMEFRPLAKKRRNHHHIMLKSNHQGMIGERVYIQATTSPLGSQLSNHSNASDRLQKQIVYSQLYNDIPPELATIVVHRKQFGFTSK